MTPNLPILIAMGRGKLADNSDTPGDVAALERRYDGPIRERLRQIARLGSETRLLAAEADGQRDFFSALIRSQIEAIRRARRGGGPIPARLLDDLKLYRRQEYWWRREAERLRALIVTPSAADVP
jgi:hypothetical protein